jgi:hypothetical protein
MSKKKSKVRKFFSKLGNGLKTVFLFWWKNGGKDKTIKKVKKRFNR